MVASKYGEKWTMRGMLRINSMNIDGVLYRLVKPMVFKVVYRYQTEAKTSTDEYVGDRIRYDSWFASTRRWGAEGTDWDDLMENINKLINRLAANGEIKVVVEG